ncbi:hypothetical protein Tco_0899718 [Tanacetum coccineum]
MLPSLKLQDPTSGKGTLILHTKSLKDSFIHYKEYQHGVPAKKKMEHIGKEKSSFHDQGYQQAAKGKKDDEEFGEICWMIQYYSGNPVKEILLKLGLPNHRSILMDSKVTPTKHGRMTKPYSSPRFIANYFIADSQKDGHGVIKEYLVKVNKRCAFWSLNRDSLKINDSDYQYAVSIKEDVAYPCLHSPKTAKETRSIRHIQRRPIRHIEDLE